MSALGVWNNRYEGGPCYAACMETFTLYSFLHAATIPPLPSAGKGATMALAASTHRRAGQKPSACARDLPLNPCQWSKASWSL